jgi:hypothetical protein
MSTLRSSLIRLASERPELRAHLLPLLGARGKRASSTPWRNAVEMQLSRDILAAINKAASPALAKYKDVPLVDQYLDGLIPIQDLVKGLTQKALLLDSPEQYIELFESGVLSKQELEVGLGAFDHLPSVIQYLGGDITIDELQRNLATRRR